MRIWSLHPQYLDTKGLVACWRETLLAQKVLEGKTKGYKNHSQLKRFKRLSDPISAIGCYLTGIWNEASERNYCFNYAKIINPNYGETIQVTTDQLYYEWQHLQNKLKVRDPAKWASNRQKHNIVPSSHPLFEIVHGPVEAWEVI